MADREKDGMYSSGVAGDNGGQDEHCIGSGRVVFRRKSFPLCPPNLELLQKHGARKFSSNLATLQEDSNCEDERNSHADTASSCGGDEYNKRERAGNGSATNSREYSRKGIRHSLTHPMHGNKLRRQSVCLPMTDDTKLLDRSPHVSATRRKSLAHSWRFGEDQSPINVPLEDSCDSKKSRRISVDFGKLPRDPGNHETRQGASNLRGRRLSLAHNWKVGSYQSPLQISEEAQAVLRRYSVVDFKPSGTRRTSFSGLPQIPGSGDYLKRRRSSIKTYPFGYVADGRRRSRVTRRSSTVPSTTAEVKKLPDAPRLITKFSAEAQFAMLKGYEDILCDTLSRSFPECSGEIERSLTPSCEHVEVVDESTNEFCKAAQTKLGNDNEIIERIYKENKPTFQDPDTVGISSAKSELANTEVLAAKTHSKSSPTMTPVQRLIMTARYQNAQQILDGIKRSKGEHVTSKNAHTTEEDGASLMDEFHSWHSRWTKEFKFS